MVHEQFRIPIYVVLEFAAIKEALALGRPCQYLQSNLGSPQTAGADDLSLTHFFFFSYHHPPLAIYYFCPRSSLLSPASPQ